MLDRLMSRNLNLLILLVLILRLELADLIVNLRLDLIVNLRLEEIAISNIRSNRVFTCVGNLINDAGLILVVGTLHLLITIMLNLLIGRGINFNLRRSNLGILFIHHSRLIITWM